MKARSIGLRAMAGLLPLLAGAMAQAADFPDRRVQLLAPFPAGSGPDVAMRAVADLLGKKWGQPVIVENRPGGNGFIAINAFKRAEPDGYTLLGVDMTHVTTHPYTFSRLPYDPDADFALIRPLFQNEFFVVVGQDSPHRSVADILAAARTGSAPLTYGSWFTGSPGHLGGLRLAAESKTKMTHVAYKETSQLYGDVARGHVDWALGSYATASSLEKAGKLRFLATTGTDKSAVYPELPMAKEAAGAGNFSLVSWVGLAAPRGTPEAVREKISRDVAEVLHSPAMQERYKAMGYDLLDLGPAAFQQYIASERKIWSRIIAEANLKLD